MTPWCIVLVCSWRHPLADRHLLPFPWTLSLSRRWCPSTSHHPVTFLFVPALTFPLYLPFLFLGLSLHRPCCPSASHHSFPFHSLGRLCQRSQRGGRGGGGGGCSPSTSGNTHRRVHRSPTTAVENSPTQSARAAQRKEYVGDIVHTTEMRGYSLRKKLFGPGTVVPVHHLCVAISNALKVCLEQVGSGVPTPGPCSHPLVSHHRQAC